ncbi:hypothetical protein Q3G72_013311 [Acer saccharum]|nr:hypothetical protein Q3G72_013311 [Acer saccharum]
MHVDLVAINTIQEKPTLLIQIDQQQQLYKVFDIQQMAYQQAHICNSKKSSSSYSQTVSSSTYDGYHQKNGIFDRK